MLPFLVGYFVANEKSIEPAGAQPTFGIMRSLMLVVLLAGTPAVDAMMPPSYFEMHGVEYSAGWKRGWVDWWKHVKGKRAMTPMVPMAPMPPFGRKSEQDGYEDGFVAGREAAMRD